MVQSLSRPTEATLKRLFAMSGNRCAFPRCSTPLVEGDIMIGEVCHIRAASTGGPRFDPLQSPDERHGSANLILLCANHHTVIDDDLIAYPVDRLLAMKADHERGTRLLDDETVARAAAVFSVGQSGGITAHTVTVHNATFTAGQGAGVLALAELSRTLLAPELGRILAHQIHALDRAAANFVSVSCGREALADHWDIFRPRRPSLYPGASQVRDLPAEELALLAEFYSQLEDIEAMLGGWRQTGEPWDVNAWNVLMQKTGASVTAGVAASDRFCADRLYDPVAPVLGTLATRAEHSLSNMRQGLQAHIDRYQSGKGLSPLPRGPRYAPAGWDPAPDPVDVEGRLRAAWWDFLNARLPLRDLPVVVSLPRVLVHLTPKAAILDGATLDHVAVDGAREVLQLRGVVGRGQNTRVWWAHGASAGVGMALPETTWTSCVYRSGVVEWELNLGGRGSEGAPATVPLDLAEALIVDALDRGLAFLRTLGLNGPVLGTAVLYGMDLAQVVLTDRPGQRFAAQSFPCPAVLLPDVAAGAADHLKPIFDWLWLEAGAPLGSPNFAAGRWRGAHTQGPGNASAAPGRRRQPDVENT